jgi:hypothetical protein
MHSGCNKLLWAHGLNSMTYAVLLDPLPIVESSNCEL